MLNETETARPNSGAIFVHSKIDDAGLSLPEFRLLAHVARRGACYGTVKEMARHCRMNKKTAYTSLKTLVERGFILKESRHGETNVYRVAPLEALPDPKEGFTQSEGQPLKRVNPLPKRGVRGFTQKEGHKVYPYKGNPLKEDSVCTNIELPRGFPNTEPEGKSAAAFVGCPENFAALTWNKAMGRAGRDAKGQPIASWRHYLAAEWSMDRNRAAENQRRGNNGHDAWSRPANRNGYIRPDHSKGF